MVTPDLEMDSSEIKTTSKTTEKSRGSNHMLNVETENESSHATVNGNFDGMYIINNNYYHYVCVIV